MKAFYLTALIIIIIAVSFSLIKVTGFTNQPNSSAASEKAKLIRKRKNDLDDLNLKGRVKSLHEILYSAEDGNGDVIKKEKVSDWTILFNEMGYRIGINETNSLGIIDKFTYRNVFADNNYRISQNEYDLNGNILYEVLFDNSGNKIKERTFGLNGSPTSTIIQEYNKKGVETKLYDTKHKNKLVIRHTKYFDEIGNIIKVFTFNSDGSLASTSVSVYDDKGNEIEKNVMATKGSLLNIVMKKTAYKLLSKYIYDDQGNWLKQVAYEDDVPTDIYERHIEYYE